MGETLGPWTLNAEWGVGQYAAAGGDTASDRALVVRDWMLAATAHSERGAATTGATNPGAASPDSHTGTVQLPLPEADIAVGETPKVWLEGRRVPAGSGFVVRRHAQTPRLQKRYCATLKEGSRLRVSR